ncbi:hypothetical protein [Alysiella crassa]|uniref:hypothetical protein n=1 Tax=Alysiella crassa TaxID=153491 RepID=UPI001FD36F31|nr:hypothetical protein [Alysiella crassa]UOP06053.1 hypothetical protein LVJ80_09375 [Alysiella crassa]
MIITFFARKLRFRLPDSTRQTNRRVRITHRNFNYLNDLVRGTHPRPTKFSSYRRGGFYIRPVGSTTIQIS